MFLQHQPCSCGSCDADTRPSVTLRVHRAIRAALVYPFRPRCAEELTVSSKVGRNDPCPCGSGKKYKRCCMRQSAGSATEPGHLTWRRLRGLLDAHHASMLEFTLRTYGPAGLDDAWQEFTADEEAHFDPESVYIELFFAWMNHWWTPDPHGEVVYPDRAYGLEPSRYWLQRHGAQAPRLLRHYFEACLHTHFSFYEAVDVEPGKRIWLQDLFTGTNHEVYEAAASRGLERGLIIFGALAETAGVTLIEGMGSVVLKARQKLSIIDLREAYRERGIDLSRAELREFADALTHAYLGLADDLHHPAMPSFCNTDGEHLEPQRLLFDIADAEAALEALAYLDFDLQPEDLGDCVERDAEGGFLRARIDWKRPGNAQHASWDNTVLGKLTFEPGRMVADVNSEERAQLLRELVDEALGSAAQFRLARRESLEAALSEQAMQERHESDEDFLAEQKALLDNPEAQAALQRYLAAHYESWPEQPLPALGGQTALEAVKTAIGREKVEALLRDIESGSARMQPGPDPEVFVGLRRRLGLL